MPLGSATLLSGCHRNRSLMSCIEEGCMNVPS
jgi:hypothetical protein